ncbi:MAG: GPW/gp25 family protein [Pseudomonadota bacterium]
MALADHYIREALNMWEPRIRLEKVAIVDPFERDPNLSNEGKLYIAIEYEIKKTLDERTLVYPFAIISEE